MSHDAYPSASDLQDLGDAHAVLAARGVLAGGAGYDLTALASAVYSQGWSYRIDRATGMTGYEAEVQARDSVTRHRAVGWEPNVALAFALCTALTARTTLRGRPPTSGS